MKIIPEENITNSYDETYSLGERVAENILKSKHSKPLILALYGELGSGKTAFVQGFAKGLGVKDRIISPTFVIMNVFPIRKPGFNNFYHFDFYRIEGASEVKNLGFEEAISDFKNIVCIEWPERIKDIVPGDCMKIAFTIEGENKRKIKVLDYGKR